jgi:uncharacterized protein YycO
MLNCSLELEANLNSATWSSGQVGKVSYEFNYFPYNSAKKYNYSLDCPLLPHPRQNQHHCDYLNR